MFTSNVPNTGYDSYKDTKEVKLRDLMCLLRPPDL